MEKAASILIIDDEPQIRSAVRNALREVADRIGEAARARVLADHTADRRADELVALLSNAGDVVSNRRPAAPMEA